MNNEIEPRSRKSSSSHVKKRDPKLRKRICWTLLALTLIVFLGAGTYIYHILNSAKDTLDKTYNGSNITKSRDVSSVLKDKRPISILLLGTDTGDLGRDDTGRTDTIIVATLNPETKTTTLTSIPRDTKVKVPDSINSYDKVNSAYTIGGVSTAIETIQDTLDIPIDYYVLVNMRGLTQIVDAVGGITIKPLLTFKYEDADVTKGKTVTMNGKQALAYSRMRYDDPEGDYGRQKRQKQVIEAIVNKSLSVSAVSNYQKLLKSIGSNMQTDLTYGDMITIATSYKDAGQTIESNVLQGQDTMLDGLSYQVASASEKKKVSDAIRKQLGLDASTKSFDDDSSLTNSTGGSTYQTTDDPTTYTNDYSSTSDYTGNYAY
ncbi:LCP family protein [Ligilactobacillus animalis]|uniref:LCP family glycopolymer transferase n=1 Tax=Ligilactobacillus animalis TaxID=1605 RepID=UPI0008258EFD|nr:LCP family protein [Ligilactobacillus animalis]OCX47329.1 LytR family transcriptional regulator [Ligilactobacillus animalis]QHQ69525.1 LytR family transcriptional regulator [Ligilactobacillus animalis]